MGQVPSHLPECVCVDRDCDLAGEHRLVEVSDRLPVDWSDVVDPHAERKDLAMFKAVVVDPHAERNDTAMLKTVHLRKHSSSHAGKAELFKQIDISRAQRNDSESTATGRSMESDLTERALSEWSSVQSEIEFVEAAPCNLKNCSTDDLAKFTKSKSIPRRPADELQQPNSARTLTEWYRTPREGQLNKAGPTHVKIATKNEHDDSVKFNALSKCLEDEHSQPGSDRTLSEWYRTPREGEFNEVAAAHLNSASKDDHDNSTEFKSLPECHADQHAQPSSERTLSEWYRMQSDGDFVQVDPANLKTASKDDHENFRKFKSLSKWLADGHSQPSCENDTTENYFVYDPSNPDS